MKSSKSIKENGPAESSKKLFVFVVRHGHRADHDPENFPEYEGHIDAPLTPHGKKQAEETGAYLKGYLQALEQKHKLAFDSIEIECSPFGRCKTTAARISSHLNVQPVKVNYHFGEVLF